MNRFVFVLVAIFVIAMIVPNVAMAEEYVSDYVFFCCDHESRDWRRSDSYDETREERERRLEEKKSALRDLRKLFAEVEEKNDVEAFKKAAKEFWKEHGEELKVFREKFSGSSGGVLSNKESPELAGFSGEETMEVLRKARELRLKRAIRATLTEARDSWARAKRIVEVETPCVKCLLSSLSYVVHAEKELAKIGMNHESTATGINDEAVGRIVKRHHALEARTLWREIRAKSWPRFQELSITLKEIQKHLSEAGISREAIGLTKESLIEVLLVVEGDLE